MGLLPLIGQHAPECSRAVAEAFRLARIRARRREGPPL